MVIIATTNYSNIIDSMEKKTGYSLSRNYFEWVFDNPEKGDVAMTALYFFIIDEFNRSGWKNKIAIYTERCMAGMGCKSPKTYRKAFQQLIECGFITVVTKSKNQYQANIISLGERSSDSAEVCAEAKNTQPNNQSDFAEVCAEVCAEAKNTEALTPFLNHMNNKTIKENNKDIEQASFSHYEIIDVVDVNQCAYYPFVEFQNWIKENAPNVATMKEPFTRDQFESITSEYDIKDIKEILEAMHNYKPLKSKNISANLTARNWLKRDKRPTLDQLGERPLQMGGRIGEIANNLNEALKRL